MIEALFTSFKVVLDFISILCLWGMLVFFIFSICVWLVPICCQIFDILFTNPEGEIERLERISRNYAVIDKQNEGTGYWDGDIYYPTPRGGK